MLPQGMTPEWIREKLHHLGTAVIQRKDNDYKTKLQVSRMFKYINQLIDYQIPRKPINISDDGHKFECPKCHTAFDSEDTYEDFNLCYVCGQRWKEVDIDG